MERTHYAPRRPYGLYVGAGAAAITLICLVILFAQIRHWADPDLRAAQRLEQYRQEQIAGQLAWLDVAIAGAWRVFPLALVGGVAYVGLLIAYRRYGQQASVYA